LLKKALDQQYGTLGTGSGGARAPAVALIGYGGEEATAGDVISEHLLTFENVAELQTRNAQLLKVVRKLSQEQEQAEARARAVGGAGGAGALVMYSGGGAGADSDPQAAMALGAALQELQSLRETRQRTEELVKTLVQQRDLYKAMLDEADTTIAASATAAASGSPPLGGPRSPPLAAGGTPRAHQQAQELQRRLLQVEDERNRARDRMSRLEEAERLVNERLEKAHAESVALRVEAAQATSEARFQRERAERLEETLKSVQSEVSAAAQRRLDMERLLVESQKDARAKDELLLQAHEALRTAQVTPFALPPTRVSPTPHRLTSCIVRLIALRTRPGVPRSSWR
jgi:nucleoprotein TPR